MFTNKELARGINFTSVDNYFIRRARINVDQSTRVQLYLSLLRIIFPKRKRGGRRNLRIFSPNLITRVKRQQPIRRERGSNQRRLSNNNNTISKIHVLEYPTVSSPMQQNALLAKTPSSKCYSLDPKLEGDTNGQSSKARKSFPRIGFSPRSLYIPR